MPLEHLSWGLKASQNTPINISGLDTPIPDWEDGEIRATLHRDDGKGSLQWTHSLADTLAEYGELDTIAKLQGYAEETMANILKVFGGKCLVEITHPRAPVAAVASSLGNTMEIRVPIITAETLADVGDHTKPFEFKDRKSTAIQMTPTQHVKTRTYGDIRLEWNDAKLGEDWRTAKPFAERLDDAIEVVKQLAMQYMLEVADTRIAGGTPFTPDSSLRQAEAARLTGALSVLRAHAEKLHKEEIDAQRDLIKKHHKLLNDYPIVENNTYPAPPDKERGDYLP